MPPPQGTTKRMLQGLEPEDAPTRVTRQKKALEESQLHKDGGSQTQIDDGSAMHMDEVSSMHMDEGGALCRDSSQMVRNKSLTVAGFSEQHEQHTLVRGKLLLCCSLFSNVSMGRHCLSNLITVLCLSLPCMHI